MGIEGRGGNRVNPEARVIGSRRGGWSGEVGGREERSVSVCEESDPLWTNKTNISWRAGELSLKLGDAQRQKPSYTAHGHYFSRLGSGHEQDVISDQAWCNIRG